MVQGAAWASQLPTHRLHAYFTRGIFVFIFVFITIASINSINKAKSKRFLQLHMTVTQPCQEYYDYVTMVRNQGGWTMTSRDINFTSRATPQETIHSEPLCPQHPRSLVEQTNVSLVPLSWEMLKGLAAKLHIKHGGWWGPQGCRARQRVAIVIPYRDREFHLRVLLGHLHPFLQRQMLEYRIFVSEQDNLSTFNRGMVKNIGVLHALELYKPDCVILHDVDLVPENDHNIYTCGKLPKHFSVAIDKQNYKPPYAWHAGGVMAMTAKQFVSVNGFSNVYFGWGSEDDDLSKRIRFHGMNVIQQDPKLGRYRKMGHALDEPNQNRWSIVRWAHCRYTLDGLNRLKYTLLSVAEHKLFTKIHSSIVEKEVMDAVPLPPHTKKFSFWQKLRSWIFKTNLTLIDTERRYL